MKISHSFQNPEIDSEDRVRRVLAAQSWLDGATATAWQTQNETAVELMATILSEPAVLKPDPVTFIVPIQGPVKPTIFLIPIMLDDQDVNDTTIMMLAPDASQSARYTENKPGRIYFAGEFDISPKLKGLLLLHEAMHAFYHETNQYRTGDDLDHWTEEVATFEFEFQLLSEICGDRYSRLMAKQVEKFRTLYTDLDGTGGKLPEPKTVDIKPLVAGLGVAISDHEIRLRQSIVWINTAYRLFDQIYPDTAGRDKAVLTRYMVSGPQNQ